MAENSSSRSPDWTFCNRLLAFFTLSGSTQEILHMFVSFFLSFVVVIGYCSERCCGEESGASNCVDLSILEFSQLTGRTLSWPQLKLILIEMGLDISAPHRNLVECQDILENVGISTVAIEASGEALATSSATAVVFFPPSVPSVPGHVIVISKTSDGEVLRVYDSSSSPSSLTVGVNKIANLPRVVALVRRCDVLRIAAIDSSYLLNCIVLGITALGLLYVVVPLCKNRSRPSLLLLARRNLTPFLSLILIGCDNSHSNSSPLQIAEHHGAFFDFGVINGDDNSSTSHTFHLKNATSAPVRVSAVSTNCGCTVAEGIAAGEVVSPGEECKVLVLVNLAGKSGEFVENVLMHCHGSDSPLVLSVAGFIKRIPTAVTPDVILKYGKSQKASHEVIVRYIRLSNDPPASVKHCRILANKESASSETRGLHVGQLVSSQESLGINSVADIWRVPVTIDATKGPSTGTAAMIIDWQVPEHTQTMVDITYAPLPAIELSTATITLTPCGLNDTLLEEIPVRVHDPDLARTAVIHCEDARVKARVDVVSKKVVFTVRPVDSGEYIVNATLICGQLRTPFVICGSVYEDR